MIKVLAAGVIAASFLAGPDALAHASALPPAETPGDLGEIDFPNSGAPAAQADFLRGVLLLHSFEFRSARAAFQAAQHADPDFAMAYWGEALSYNMPIWGEQDLSGARAALGKLAPIAAERMAKAPTERERDYLASVERLYGEGDKTLRDARYSAALGEMAQKYPADLEARAFYTLSLLGLTGYKRHLGNYMRAAAEAEAIYEINRRHPGALHYLIHAYDDPVHAPLGLRAARLYGKVAPAASHAQHMPSHIFFALGLWDEAIEANVASFRTARDQGQGGYHSLLWLAYAYLQEGRVEEAGKLVDLVARDVATAPDQDNRANLAYVRATWLVETGGANRAGVWDEVDNSGIASIAFFSAHDFARGLIEAREERPDAARTTLARLRNRTEVARDFVTGVSASRYDTVAPEEIEQAEVMATALEGVIRFAGGEREQGLTAVRAAIAAANQMAFEYGPPWSVKPLDELLGEMLLVAGRQEEAAAAFERALAEHPNRKLSRDGLSSARHSSEASR